ncbi:hypothetical protein [Amycolatopsis regifaucium]|uniref:Uncharacterized protein n=1 Tax=Amycolatopsis regifaucium TaxID=546365 RepID=A0A154M3T6_9PSEU|nr:hypothetical protein [Amycolatopsis regifaucium]KZB79275.1 hypothetical protein AVL48_16920 [Amycolatopsis regifaucium]OKA07457.1 hypothetical protein ATP06_0216605 [Amycolatopsis regifaucium]SFH11022.1 hypothetical protein SAMN04489731_102493 [Amycolatopsis regifaucium]
MAEIMTFPEAPVREGSTFPITIEDDASPVVRLIGRTLRDSSRIGHAHELLGRADGTVAIRSHDTPQAATISSGHKAITVTGGVFGEPDATVVVDLRRRFASTREPAGDVVLAAGILRALTPPLPHWRESARHFWAVTRGIPGIPEVLIVDADGPGGPERHRFGDGTTEYLMAGPPDVLAGVFSGADDFVASLAAGLRLKGTLAQMSVMTAASWRVRFDV